MGADSEKTCLLCGGAGQIEATASNGQPMTVPCSPCMLARMERDLFSEAGESHGRFDWVPAEGPKSCHEFVEKLRKGGRTLSPKEFALVLDAWGAARRSKQYQQAQGVALTTGEILAIERRSAMTDDEAIRFARSVESAIQGKAPTALAAVPEGWRIRKESTGIHEIRVDTPTDQHCFVPLLEDAPDHHPINIFYALLETMLAAAPTPAEPYDRERLSPAEFHRLYSQNPTPADPEDGGDHEKA